MTNEEIKNTLVRIRMALDGVQVYGKGNLGNLFGSISALDELIQELAADPSEEGEKGV